MEDNIQIDILKRAGQVNSVAEWSCLLNTLMAENGHLPCSALEQQLVDLRIRAFRESDWPAPDVSWPPVYRALPAQGRKLPEIALDGLNVETLRSGIMGNGGLIVRGLMDEKTVDRMRGNINRTLRARTGGSEAESGLDRKSWYTRSAQVKGSPAQFFALDSEVQSASASVWVVDAPRMANELIQFYQAIGLPGLLQNYFSEPATLSVKKWVLRRVAPDNGSESGWHQDGRFLGDGIRTVNMWIALTDCGGDASAPGIEIVGGHENIIYETGTQGAPFDWTVGQGLVDSLGEESPVLCPRFAPGDAVFFDHYNLHRTAFGIDHSQDRYALESWFFAASRAPEKQIPVFL